MFKRVIAPLVGALLLGLAAVAPAAASTPQVYTWSNPVDVAYFDCGAFEAHGVWTITHRLTIFVDGSGTPVRDIERVDFRGAFVNPLTGASIPDGGHIEYFDTLDPDGDIATTIKTFVRNNPYLHEAGRYDFQTDAFSGMSRFDAGVAAACAALG